MKNGEFTSGLVVRICCVHCRGLDSIPGQRTEIPQDTQCVCGVGQGIKKDMISRIIEC